MPSPTPGSDLDDRGDRGPVDTVPRERTRPAGVAGRRFTLLRDYGILLSLLAMVVALSLSTDTFLTAGNLVNLLDQAVVVGLLACGATLCIIAGVFDLSMSAVLAVSAIVAVLVTTEAGVTLGVLAALGTGAVLGACNGIVVMTARVHSFIATLAASIVYRGLAVIITGGAIVYPAAGQLAAFQSLSWPTVLGGVTASSLLFLLVAAVCWVLLSGTTYGRRIYAVGGNEEAARLSGVRVGLIRVSVFVLSGICAALAGLVLASRGGSAQASMGTLLELTAIAAAVVGGTSVRGGEGAIWRGMIGVLILTLIGNGFNLLGWDTTYKQVVEGLLILGAVSMDQVLRRRRT
ncbi:ABC transporter permease [Amycolatopsis cihanbeyliensis]|uniref:Monosaccharide ABC transporter membrane protein (CUT2 family) n=1 Tax=Amycolatopsis cihanbeyliensis TaxID=1128664 RepID=A0A542CSX3_AMYCI|nr:ABC transporter permease [Amycolatopsis cihanbeyliensis]TQI93923.1 monosaccharide ABC transporter membrane protein (CUT2 family) [Amycolatopsis cihanbeyliensis]